MTDKPANAIEAQEPGRARTAWERLTDEQRERINLRVARRLRERADDPRIFKNYVDTLFRMLMRSQERRSLRASEESQPSEVMKPN